MVNGNKKAASRPLKIGNTVNALVLCGANGNLPLTIMFFRGTHENSLLAITSVKDDKKRNIVISIDLNKQESFSYANSVTSIYGRDNLERYIEKNIDNGNLLAVNTNKADKMLHSIGKSYPEENTFINFDNSIAFTMENVNNKNKIFFEKDGNTHSVFRNGGNNGNEI